MKTNKRYMENPVRFIALMLSAVLLFTSCSVLESKNTAAANSVAEKTTASVPITPQEQVKAEEPKDLFSKDLIAGKLAVYFLALPGEAHTGESILIITPNGKTILVDSGIAECGKLISDRLKQLNIARIDYVIATHMHEDHVGGFGKIIPEFEVGQIYTSTFINHQTKPAQLLQTMAKACEIPMQAVAVGQVLEPDEDVVIEFMHPDTESTPPDTPTPSVTSAFLNDSSVVFKLTYREKSILFTGDIHNSAEALLIERYGDELKSDVIKIPHHGGSSSSSPAFVKAVGATDSVMCIYAFNDFNVYDRYKQVGNRPYVTSLDGNVLMITDGKNISFQVEKERKGMLK